VAALPPTTKTTTRGSASSAQKPQTAEPPCQKCGWQPDPGKLWPTHGAIAVRWIHDNLIFAEGDWYGRPFRLRTDQKLFLFRWYEYCPACWTDTTRPPYWRYRRALRGAAKGDGKTALIAALGCLEFAGPPCIAPPSPNVPIMASSYEQADILFSAAATMLGGRDDTVKEAPLCGFFDVFDSEVRFKDGRPGRMYRVAAVAGSNDGGLPTTLIADEVHELGDVGSSKARAHLVISNGLQKRQFGREINLSTAGFDVDRSLLGALYKHGKRVEHDPYLDPQFLMDWQEAPDGLDYDDPKDREIAVRAASTAADVLWDVAGRVRRYDQPGVQKHEWIRYYANRWVDVASESWLKDHPAAWASCKGHWERDEANPFTLAVDMALRHDSVAVDRIEELPDGRFAASARVWKADARGRIDHEAVWDYILQEARGPEFRGVVYDPRFFEVPARMLEDHGVLAIQFDQSPQRMAPAVGLTYERILAGQIVHDGDPELTNAVKAAVAYPQERGGFTLRKGKSKRHIDACVAMCMGVWVLAEVPVLDEPPNLW
jgi:phage terminase large subunit-like protein